MEETLSYSIYNGSKLEYKKSGESEYTQIKGIVTMPDFGGEPSEVDTTTLDNLKYETSKNGLMPAVKLTYEYNLEDPSATANIKLASDLEDEGGIYDWKVTLSNGITFTYRSDVKTSIKGGGSNELIKFEMYHSPVTEVVRTIPTSTANNGD